MDDFLADLGEDAQTFTVVKGDEEQFNVKGIRKREERQTLFDPNADISEGDIVVATATGAEFSIDEIDWVLIEGNVKYAMIGIYDASANRQDAPQSQQTTNTFNNYGSNYGPQGSGNTNRQEFTFKAGTSLDDLERLIHECGGEDIPELLELAEEIRGVAERGESFEPERFGKWRELLERHAQWLLGPTAAVVTSQIFGQMGGG